LYREAARARLAYKKLVKCFKEALWKCRYCVFQINTLTLFGGH
jgi:hypothetical protein